jgi:hypothetical protein
MARTATTLTNTASGIPFKPCARASGGNLSAPGELINSYTGVGFLEANSQFFKAGDMVYLNAGAVTEVLTAGIGAIAGFALTDATNVTSGNAAIRIMPVNTEDTYVMNVYSGTEGNTNWDNIMTTNIGGAYNIIQLTVTEADGSTVYCSAVDIDTTTAPRVRIVGVDVTPEMQTAPSTKSYIRVKVKFQPGVYVDSTHYYANCQF